MNYITRISFFVLFSGGFIGCTSMSPTTNQKEHLEPISNIMITTNLKDTPVVSYLGTTLFENKITYLEDFEFKLSHYAIEKADSALKSKGYSIIVSEKPLSDEAIRDLYGFRSTRVSTAKSLASHGAEALLLIEQGNAQTGLSYGHGHSIEENGIFLVRSIIGRRDKIKVPVIISYYDLRTGKLLSRVRSENEETIDFTEIFSHITEANDVTEADKKAIIEIYKSYFDTVLSKALASIKPILENL